MTEKDPVRYEVADIFRKHLNDKGIVLKTMEAEVVAETSDSPPETREVTIKPTIETDTDESTIQGLIDQAFHESLVANMLRNPVSIKLG